MAYFGAPVGLSSSWSGSCSWSGCQAPAQAPQYYPLPPPAPPAQYYPPQSPPPQYAGSNWFDVHPIFWVFIIFIALKLYYTDFYWAIQHLPNPYLAQPVVAPIWNTQANQNQQKDDSKKNQNQNQQKDENKKDKNQNQQKDENKKDKIQDQQKYQNQKDNDKDQQKNENKSKDNKSNTVIVRPSCKYFAGQRIWVTENGVRWWGILVLDRGGGNWYGHKVVYGGKRYGRPELQTVPFFAKESELETRWENFGSEKEPQYVNKTIICGCP